MTASKTALIIFPHQLFRKHPGLEQNPDRVVLVEEPLFFADPQYKAKFHKLNLAYHRATMDRFIARLRQGQHETKRVAYAHDTELLAKTIMKLAGEGFGRVVVAYVHDFILEKRLTAACKGANVELDVLDSPAFLNTPQLNAEYRAGKRRWFMADFYKFQRKRLNILMDGTEPVGDKWSFDEDNRKAVPKKKRADVPFIAPRKPTPTEEEAREWVEANFADHYGKADQFWYPIDHEEAAEWLERFLTERFHLFGDYEDAILKGESWLWHSVLTPMLNIGLLTPRQVVNKTLAFADKHDVPLNALEGFLRQIIGWREFMHATYCDLGVEMRTTNHWNHTRKLPQSWYDGTTGIGPVDDAIKRINETGYAHHIERLMVLGGFMFLCEFDPDDIYRWFMEMFIDAYDWVMVPNVYAMSQNADGGNITTKPYFSGSNYVKKMSDWTGKEDGGAKGQNWAEVWDALYWTWIDKHADELEKNPRWAMMVAASRRMGVDKIVAHKERAKSFKS